MDQQQFPRGPQKGFPDDSEDRPHAHGEWSPDWERSEPEPESAVSVLYLPLGLFVVTVFTTFWAGAYQVN